MPTLVMISNKQPDKGLTRAEQWVRGLFVAVYAVVTVSMFFSPELEIAGQLFTVPRLFWTIVLPLVPIGIVIAGFYPWRKVCPLAFWGSLGRKLDAALAKGRQARADAAAKGEGKEAKKIKSKPRRVPRWAEAAFPLISLAMLAIALVGRLLLTNGDGIMLGGLLVLLGVGAAAVNWRYTGKTWCNFVCPVSIVERIYTEPNSLRLEHNSQCLKCTACKKNCPDIDQENSYWKGTGDRAKRMAYYAFPGLVLAFYTYYWLRAGDWEAYFDGAWTHQPVTQDLLTGPGFFFAPMIPAYVAAPLSLLAFMAVSFLLFAGLEKLLARVWTDEILLSHRVFTLAAFAAFNIFYLFAGAPTLGKIPYGTRVLAFVVPLVATMFLVKRWRRSRKDFMEEKSAKKLLRKWTFKDPPPDDPAGVFAYFKAKEAHEEQQLAVYRESVREVFSDEVITKHEAALVELLRTQLGITEGQHRKVMEELRADSTKVISVEEELQLQGYRDALTQAMLDNASENEIRRLRREYAVDRETHERIANELRGDRSPIVERAREALDQIAELRTDFSMPLAPLRASGTFEFAIFVLERMRERALERVIEALPLTVPVKRAAQVRKVAAGLAQRELEHRRHAVELLEPLIDAELHGRIAEVLLVPPLTQAALSQAPDEAAFEACVGRMLAHGDPYLRAGAIQAVAHLRLTAFAQQLVDALDHEEPLVRETAVYAALRAPEMIDPSALEPLMRDEDPQIRRAAREAIEALTTSQPGPPPPPIQLSDGRTLPPLPDEAFSTLATTDKLLFLRCVSLFEELDPEDLHEVSRVARDHTVPESGAICRQGDATDDLYVLISGTARVVVETAEAEQQVAELGPGDVVGELAAIDQSPRSASVLPKDGPVRLLEIRGEDFRRRVIKRRDVAPKLMATLSRRLRETLARVR